jgi:hypothetical protein
MKYKEKDDSREILLEISDLGKQSKENSRRRH